MLDQACASECHETIKSNLPRYPGLYSIIDNHHALAYTSVSDMMQIAQSHQNIIQDFAPMAPEIKLEKGIFSACQRSSRSRKNPRMRLRIFVSPLYDQEADNFHKSLDHLKANFQYPISSSSSATASSSISRPSLEFNRNDIQYGTYHSFIITLHNSEGKVLRNDHDECIMIEEVAKNLAALPQVRWVEREWDMHLLNRWSKGVCQTGESHNANLHTAPGGNLTGLGEIVGIADSGIDMSSCYFNDPDVPTPYHSVNYNHRKVRYKLFL
jgi:hypothetical protein